MIDCVWIWSRQYASITITNLSNTHGGCTGLYVSWKKTKSAREAILASGLGVQLTVRAVLVSHLSYIRMEHTPFYICFFFRYPYYAVAKSTSRWIGRSLSGLWAVACYHLMNTQFYMPILCVHIYIYICIHILNVYVLYNIHICIIVFLVRRRDTGFVKRNIHDSVAIGIFAKHFD